MKKLFIPLILLSILATACNTNQSPKIDTNSGAALKDEFTYDKAKNPEIDNNTFQILTVDSYSSNYAKDKNFAYYSERGDCKNCSWKKIDGVDVATFEAYPGFAKDKNHVYSNGEPIGNSDPTTLEYITLNPKYGYGYLKDKNNVYNNNPDFTQLVKIDGADPNTFEELGIHNLAKDKNSIYQDGIKIEGSDSETFEVLNNLYYRDKNYGYYLFIKVECYSNCAAQKIEGSDGKTFQAINYFIAKDDKSVYTPNHKLEGADPESFVLLDSKKELTFAKDKNVVYFSKENSCSPACEMEKVNKSDPETFEFINDSFAKDKNAVYVIMTPEETAEYEKCPQIVRVEVTDTNNFKYIKGLYWHDGENVYKAMKKLENADPSTFVAP